MLHFLRQALGTQTTPSNQVLVGMGLFLTLLIVHPVASEIYAQAWEADGKGKLTMEQAAERAGKAAESFLDQVRPGERRCDAARNLEDGGPGPAGRTLARRSWCRPTSCRS